MPFCPNCGKEVSQDVSFCPGCGARLKIQEKSETHSRPRRKVAWFFIGLIVVGAICGVSFLIEDLTIPHDLAVQIELVKKLRQLPYELQLSIATEKGITVEELLASPYDPWAPKVSIGLLIAYAIGGGIYLASRSSRSSVDREIPAQTAFRQPLSNADAYYKQGDVHDERGEFGKAITDYNKSIELNPNHADAYSERGDFYYEAGEYDKAAIDYDKAIKLDPNGANAYYNRGCAYSEMGEYEKAIADYNKAIELDPNDAYTYYSRGLAYHEKGEVPKAVSDLEKCIGLSTDTELMADVQRALNEIGKSP